MKVQRACPSNYRFIIDIRDACVTSSPKTNDYDKTSLTQRKQIVGIQHVNLPQTSRLFLVGDNE